MQLPRFVPALLATAIVLSLSSALPANAEEVSKSVAAAVTAVTTDTKGAKVAREVVIEPAAPKRIRNRAIDTASLYEQAGMEINANQSATAGWSVNTDAQGAIVPPPLNAHVDQPCVGTGSDGARVQVLYAHKAGQSRFAQVKPLLLQEIRFMDDAFALSSASINGVKRVRWLADAQCVPIVGSVQLPDAAFTGMGETRTALEAAGYLTGTRRVLVYADTPMGGMGNRCGAAEMHQTSVKANNPNNAGALLARVDAACWITGDPANASTHATSPYHSIGLHELTHSLGAVVLDAPHHDGTSHCTDGADTLCYNVDPASGCTDWWQLDCNRDDYFNANPQPGNYLATHWNTADSIFLTNTGLALPAPPAATLSPNPASPDFNESATVTVATEAGANIKWETDAPTASCDTSTAADKRSLTVTCTRPPSGGLVVTVAARVWRTGQKTVKNVTTTVSYLTGEMPSVVIDSVPSAANNAQFTLYTDLYDAPGVWTYQWRGPEGCTFHNGTATAADAVVSCNSAVSSDFVVFAVTATRPRDGASTGNERAVQIGTSTNAPMTVAISGSTAVSPGQSVTFTAQTTNAGNNPTFEWGTQRGYGTSASQTFTFTVPANAPAGSDSVYLHVVGSGGSQSAGFTYTVAGPLALNIDGPDDLDGGEVGNFVANASKPAQFAWSSSACTLTASSNAANLTCPATFTGTVTVIATANTGTESVTASRVVNVTGASGPEAGARESKVVLSVVSTAHPATFTVNLSDRKNNAGLSGKTVQLERRNLTGGAYAVVSTMRTDGRGTASVALTVNDPGFYRVQFAGDNGYSASVSLEQATPVFTKLVAAKWAPKGLKATLKTGGGKAMASQKVVLMKKVGKQWKKVKAYKTNTKGLVKVKINPTKKTVYMFSYIGVHGYRTSTSGSVTLK